MLFRLAFILTTFLLQTGFVKAQDTAIIQLQQIPSKYLETVSSKANALEEKLDKKSQKALAGLQKQEAKMKRKLMKIDSLAASNVFASADNKYKELEQKLQHSKLKQYIPKLDSLSTSLKFLESNPELLSKVKEGKEKLQDAISKMKGLEGQLQKAENIKQFMRERKQYLKDQLSKFGFAKDLKKFNKQAYYYSQLVKDYKEILSDPKKIEKHAIALLNKIPAFRKFMEKNSMLTSIFGLPSASSGAVSFSNIQTRASVQQLVSNAAITAGPNPAQFISQQLQTANDQLNSLKNKVAFIDLSGSEEQMPDFKPNQQKTKSFLKRLEMGANLQFGKANNFLPTSGDFAFSLGYKLNDNGVIGIGSSYKLGLGSIRDIEFSSQGFGLRSFIDWKIKGSFYISGGYEKNYLPQLQNLSVTQELNTWQESGLIGVSKKLSVSKKRKLTFQVLFDFLSYQNLPRSQPILFRTGWVF